MKKLLTICLICFLAIPTKAHLDNQPILFGPVVETSPEFPGGIEALFKFIAENINLPAEIVCDQCRTICQFVVEKDGSISNVQVVRSSGDDFLDKEAVRVLSIMPKWKPGEQQGKPIRTTYAIPINWIPAYSPQ